MRISLRTWRALQGNRWSWWIVPAVISAIWLSVGVPRGLVGDTRFYFETGAAILRGESPYRDLYSYIYPPLLAHVWAGAMAWNAGWAVDAWNLLMALSAIALIVMAVLISGGVGSVAGWAAFLFLFAPSNDLGNPSILIVALTLLSILVHRSRPWVGGLILGLATSLKPLPLVLIPFLVVRGFWHGDRSSRRSAVAAILVFLPLAFLLPHSRDYVSLAHEILTSQAVAGSNCAWTVYAIRVFGWSAEVSIGFFLTLGILGAGVLALGSFREERRTWAGVLTLCFLSAPSLWRHSYYALCVLPLMVLVMANIEGSWLTRLPRRSAVLLGWSMVALFLGAILHSKFYFAGGHFLTEVATPLIPLLCPLVCAGTLLRSDTDVRGARCSR